MAFETQGTEFYWSTSTAASTSTTALIGQVIDFNGPGGQANVIDVTNLNSTAKEKLMGLRDEGQLSMNMFCAFGDAGQDNLRADRAARNKRKVVIKFNDSASYFAIFDGYCLGFSVTGAVDDAVKANCVIEIADAVTYTTTLS